MNIQPVLITGGCGFIGSHLVDRLSRSHPVIILDDLSSGFSHNITSENTNIIIGSVTDAPLLDRIFSTYRFNAVFHLAAVASVQVCQERPVESHAVNATATLDLVHRAAANGVERFIFASSAAIYGDHPELPKTENSPIQPISVYGIDKYASERYVVEFGTTSGMAATAFRFFNVFGPRQNPGSPYSGVLSIFMKRLIDQGESSVTIFGDGEQTRDFTYIDNVIDALMLSLERDLGGRVFNTGCGESVSLLHVVNSFSTLLNRPIDIDFQPSRHGDIKFSAADISELLAVGYQPRFDFDTGLRAYLSNYDH